MFYLDDEDLRLISNERDRIRSYTVAGDELVNIPYTYTVG